MFLSNKIIFWVNLRLFPKEVFWIEFKTGFSWLDEEILLWWYIPVNLKGRTSGDRLDEKFLSTSLRSFCLGSNSLFVKNSLCSRNHSRCLRMILFWRISVALAFWNLISMFFIASTIVFKITFTSTASLTYSVIAIFTLSELN